jgi:hypothetical protein
MTLPDTFEQDFRQNVVDLIYGQWAALGAPFAARSNADDDVVIDPEALVWASLEFLPTEPRLGEAVLGWLTDHAHYVVRQRIIRAARRDETRAAIWQALDRPNLEVESLPKKADLSQTEEIVRWITAARGRSERRLRKVNQLRKEPSTLLLRARDLIGHDVRHFLLVYLLARPHGGKLRDVEQWSRYTYRSLAEAATRWEAANVVSLEAGFCRLLVNEPFHQLLHIRSERIALVNWWEVFDVSIRLLRDLAAASSKGFTSDDAIVRSLRREASEKLDAALLDPTARSKLTLRRRLQSVS